MSEQKRYTAHDFRHAVFARQARMNMVPLEHPTEDELDEMLEQAADSEEENTQLKARLEAVVKECENQMPEQMFIRMNDEASLQAKESIAAILRAARGEGGAK